MIWAIYKILSVATKNTIPEICKELLQYNEAYATDNTNKVVELDENLPKYNEDLMKLAL